MMKITSMEETDISVVILHGDGQQRSFDVGYELHRAPIIALNGYYQKDGQKGIDGNGWEWDLTGKPTNWFWERGSSIVTQHPDSDVVMPEDRLDIIFIGKFKVETITA